ncbi:Beta-scruin [Scenedesmus sp. PABB004]|nr:Beta-scruin [Scenedesmus sp. PABB004]
MEEQGWFRLAADEFVATLSTACLASQPQSCALATLVELARAQQRAPDGGAQPPTVRLDCAGEVARELAAVLRLGAAYVLPPCPRLLRAVQQQVDFLGLTAPSLPSAAALAPREVVLVPGYWHIGLNAALDPHAEPSEAGLLMYSGAARGWANLTGRADARPAELRGVAHPHSGGGCWLAATLRAEATGAGEDIVCVVPNKTHATKRYPDSAVLLRASLAAGRMAMPPLHKRLGLCDSAMAAAQGKLYLFGGSGCPGGSPCCPLEVYDPSLDAWFTARSPVAGPMAALAGHALVANAEEGVLIALGGVITATSSGGRRGARANDDVALFDPGAGRWELRPGGCRWPGPAGGGAGGASVAAAAGSSHEIVVVSADGGGAAATARTDVLDLRTWRWRAGAPLAGDHCGSDGDGDCQANVGLVRYEGRVHAIGGRHSWQDGESATARVAAYDLAADAWTPLAPLPFPICHASPVVVRVPSVL